MTVEQPPASKRTLLVVDDELPMRETLREVLEEHGYVVHVASDGAEALTMLDHGTTPCLVITDLRMPRMDGRELRAAMLARKSAASLPVIVVSGEPNLGATAQAMGCSAYLSKPLQLEALLAAVERCL